MTRLSARPQETRSLPLQMRYPFPSCRSPPPCLQEIQYSQVPLVFIVVLDLVYHRGRLLPPRAGAQPHRPYPRGGRCPFLGQGLDHHTGAPRETRCPLVGAQTGTNMWRCSTWTLTDTHTYMHTVRHMHTHHPYACEPHAYTVRHTHARTVRHTHVHALRHTCTCGMAHGCTHSMAHVCAHGTAHTCTHTIAICIIHTQRHTAAHATHAHARTVQTAHTLRGDGSVATNP